VLASRSPHRRYLPDKPTPLIDTEHGADGQDSGLPSAGTSDKKQKTRKRKRIPWAQLLKRTFKIDVLKCDKCGGRMKLVAVVFDPPTISTTLRALGLPVRAPPIAPAKRLGSGKEIVWKFSVRNITHAGFACTIRLALFF
jgi:hypothetical protein